MNAIEMLKVGDVPISFNLSPADDVKHGFVGVQKAAKLEDKLNITFGNSPL